MTTFALSMYLSPYCAVGLHIVQSAKCHTTRFLHILGRLPVHDPWLRPVLSLREQHLRSAATSEVYRNTFPVRSTRLCTMGVSLEYWYVFCFRGGGYEPVNFSQHSMDMLASNDCMASIIHDCDVEWIPSPMGNFPLPLSLQWPTTWTSANSLGNPIIFRTPLLEVRHRLMRLLWKRERGKSGGSIFYGVPSPPLSFPLSLSHKWINLIQLMLKHVYNPITMFMKMATGNGIRPRAVIRDQHAAWGHTHRGAPRRQDEIIHYGDPFLGWCCEQIYEIRFPTNASGRIWNTNRQGREPVQLGSSQGESVALESPSGTHQERPNYGVWNWALSPNSYHDMV